MHITFKSYFWGVAAICTAGNCVAASVPAQLVYYDNKRDTGYYENSGAACQAATNLVSHGYSEDPSTGPGCLVETPSGATYHYQNWVLPYLVCHEGSTLLGSDCISEEPEKDKTCPAGNPVKIGTGAKIQQEVDFSLGGAIPLKIEKTTYPISTTRPHIMVIDGH